MVRGTINEHKASNTSQPRLSRILPRLMALIARTMARSAIAASTRIIGGGGPIVAIRGETAITSPLVRLDSDCPPNTQLRSARCAKAHAEPLWRRGRFVSLLCSATYSAPVFTWAPASSEARTRSVSPSLPTISTSACTETAGTPARRALQTEPRASTFNGVSDMTRAWKPINTSPSGPIVLSVRDAPGNRARSKNVPATNAIVKTKIARRSQSGIANQTTTPTLATMSARTPAALGFIRPLGASH